MKTFVPKQNFVHPGLTPVGFAENFFAEHGSFALPGFDLKVEHIAFAWAHHVENFFVEPHNFALVELALKARHIVVARAFGFEHYSC